MIIGKLLLQNSDYGKSVSAVDINLNGSQINIVYIVDNEIKAGSISCVQNFDGSLPAVMSGVSVI